MIHPNQTLYDDFWNTLERLKGPYELFHESWAARADYAAQRMRSEASTKSVFAVPGFLQHWHPGRPLNKQQHVPNEIPAGWVDGDEARYRTLSELFMKQKCAVHNSHDVLRFSDLVLLELRLLLDIPPSRESLEPMAASPPPPANTHAGGMLLDPAADSADSPVTMDDLLRLYRQACVCKADAQRPAKARQPEFWAHMPDLKRTFAAHMVCAEERSEKAANRETAIEGVATDLVVDAIKDERDREIAAEITLSALLWQQDHDKYIELSRLLNIDQLSGQLDKLLEFLKLDLRIKHGDGLEWAANPESMREDNHLDTSNGDKPLEIAAAAGRGQSSSKRKRKGGLESACVGASQQCCGELMPDHLIVGNRIQALYDDNVWYDGRIDRINLRKRGARVTKSLHVRFDDGDEREFSTAKAEDMEGFRHVPLKEDGMTKRWSAVHRLLCTFGEVGPSLVCPISNEPLSSKGKLDELRTKIMQQSLAGPRNLAKLEQFLLGQAEVRKLNPVLAQWAVDVEAQIPRKHSGVRTREPASSDRDDLASTKRTRSMADAGTQQYVEIEFTTWNREKIVDWPWGQINVLPEQKLAPHHVAAGLMAKIYEAALDGEMIETNQDIVIDMRRVLAELKAWNGNCLFPDFMEWSQVRCMDHFSAFQREHMTRKMTNEEQHWLLARTDTALDTFREFGIHKDDSIVLPFVKLRDKTPLDGIAVLPDPYGRLSGHVPELGDLEATMHQIRADGSCLYLAYPVALFWSVEKAQLPARLKRPYTTRVERVCECASEILKGSDLHGRGYRKLLVEFLQEQKPDSGLYAHLSKSQLPSDYGDEDSSKSRIQHWTVYIDNDGNKANWYANETVFAIMNAFLPCATPFIVSCSRLVGPYRYSSMTNIVADLEDSKYIGHRFGILLLLSVGGGRSEGGEYGQWNHYEPMKPNRHLFFGSHLGEDGVDSDSNGGDGGGGGVGGAGSAAVSLVPFGTSLAENSSHPDGACGSGSNSGGGGGNGGGGDGHGSGGSHFGEDGVGSDSNGGGGGVDGGSDGGAAQTSLEEGSRRESRTDGEGGSGGDGDAGGGNGGGDGDGRVNSSENSEQSVSDSFSADDAAAGGAAAPSSSVRSGAGLQRSLHPFLVAASASRQFPCVYCGEVGTIGCIKSTCSLAVCQVCLEWKKGKAAGFYCDAHRAEKNGKPTIMISAKWCVECGPGRWGQTYAHRCGLCGKRLCHFHAETTHSARSIFKDPTSRPRTAPKSRCRACFGEDSSGFEKLREEAAQLLLGLMLGESCISLLTAWPLERMKRQLESRARIPGTSCTRLVKLAEELSAFIFSLVCCGSGQLASRLMRILMTLNLALESQGQSIATLPFHFLYMLTTHISQLASPRLLAKAVQSYGQFILKEERARRTKATAVTFPPFQAAKARANVKTRIAIAISDGLDSSPALDLIFGTVLRWLQDTTLEIWLIVRSPIKAKQLQEGTAVPYDECYPPAVELVRALGQGRIIYICSDHLDDHLVNEGLQHHWNVILHANGFNYGHFWHSLVMAPLAEIYLEFQSLASLLLNDMGRDLGVAHWTIASQRLVSPVQLGVQERDPYVDIQCPYATEAWYQAKVLEWGDPPPPSGPPGLVYCGVVTRLTESEGAPFLQAVVDILHQAFVAHDMKARLHLQGPTSKIIQIKAFVRKYCAECNYSEELNDRIFQIPFYRDKQKYIRFLWEHQELVPVSGEPIGPHTGCVDAAITYKGTLNWASAHAEWQARVAQIINIELGLGDVLNTTTREEFTQKGVELMSDLNLIQALNNHNRSEMKAGQGFYSVPRVADALKETIPHLLALARNDNPVGKRLPDVKTTQFVSTKPSPRFVSPAKITTVGDSLAMKVQEVLQVFARKGCQFVGGFKAAAVTAVEKALEVMTFDPSTVRRGGARVTFQGFVRQTENKQVAWSENMKAVVKFEYPKDGGLVITSSNAHNSENVREGQHAHAIEATLQKQGRMRNTVPKLLPLLDKGRAAVGFVKAVLSDLTNAAKKPAKHSSATSRATEGLLIFLFCEVVPEGSDMHGSKTLKAAQGLWRENGEIGENARNIARNVLHTGAWMAEKTGFVQLDVSLGNLHLIPWELTSPWLDATVRNRMPEPGGAGWCDLGGCIYIGTQSERSDRQQRSSSRTAVPGLMRIATQTDAPATAKRPRFPKTDKQNFGVMTSATLNQFAEHRRQNSAGNGRPTGGTPEFTCRALKASFDKAGDDEAVAANLGILWQSFSEGAILYSIFVPHVTGVSRTEYVRQRETAAASQEAMLNCMMQQVNDGVEIKQPETAALFANLIFNLMNPVIAKRVSDTAACLHPALTHLIFTKEVQDAVQRGGYLIPGRRGPPGSKYEDQECPPWLLKPDGPNGSWGTGAFATKPIRAGQLSGWYVGLAHSMQITQSSLHEYPPGIANVTVFDGSAEVELTALGELPLELLVELGAPGVFFNAKSNGNGANLRLERTERVVIGGLLYIPFFALCDINEGDGGYWAYAPDKGRGGKGSYNFDDSIFDVRKLSTEQISSIRNRCYEQ